jgi:hypothetical protein
VFTYRVDQQCVTLFHVLHSSTMPAIGDADADAVEFMYVHIQTKNVVVISSFFVRLDGNFGLLPAEHGVKTMDDMIARFLDKDDYEGSMLLGDMADLDQQQGFKDEGKGIARVIRVVPYVMDGEIPAGMRVCRRVRRQLFDK